ncbi:hypothetical protein [Shimia sp. R9_3]|uniref:hypothetical protein n=1 Tax=Shimia sp. R9_3 TaxID=2821113 RepID=UPI001ADC8F8A|nr:hypothetical protein [Shimia sp. R9_3]MBO9401787.1 hypothetical protein [Shimia sp. R9_3]
MKRCLATAIAVATFGLSTQTSAEVTPAPFTLSVGESVLGHTFEAGYRFNSRFGVRGLYGDGSVSIDTSLEGNQYDGDVSLGGFGLIFDYYTSGNTFRLSAGAVTLDHRFDGATSGNIVVNGTSYSAPLNLSASFDQSLAPMIALGVQTPIRNSRFVFTGDLGVVYTGGATASGSDPTNTIVQSDIDAELSDINNTLDDLPIAPFLKVGIGFQF